MKRSQIFWISLVLASFLTLVILQGAFVGLLIITALLLMVVYIVICFIDAWDDDGSILPHRFNIIRGINQIIDKL